MIYIDYKLYTCINVCNIILTECNRQYQNVNAMKETRPAESDRNTASPTESAVCGRQEREHSGADYLNRIVCARIIRYTR